MNFEFLLTTNSFKTKNSVMLDREHTYVVWYLSVRF